jgi:hypothetical protein
MLIKIHRGTPLNDGEALCDTCAHPRLIRGRRLEDEIVQRPRAASSRNAVLEKRCWRFVTCRAPACSGAR